MLFESNIMTMHDALFFLNWLHREIGKQGSYTERGSWPTREIVVRNLDGNHDFFPRDNHVRQAFDRQFGIALSRHWTAEGPCSKHCHAKHLWITETGKAILAMMNQEGCVEGELHYAA